MAAEWQNDAPRPRTFRPGQIAAFLVAALLFPALPGGGGSAAAASLEVAPVSLELQPGQMAGVITVTNRDRTRTAVQLRSFHWTQPGGQDQLDPTREMLVSPPIFELAPGAAQTVRVVLRRPAEAPESTYRLFLDEIPVADAVPRGVRFALRLSLPVFARAGAEGSPRLEWRWAGDRVIVSNRGDRRAQIANLAIQGGAVLRGPEIPYILAGVEREWRFNGPPPRGGTLRLTGLGENGSFTVDVPASGSR